MCDEECGAEQEAPIDEECFAVPEDPALQPLTKAQRVQQFLATGRCRFRAGNIEIDCGSKFLMLDVKIDGRRIPAVRSVTLIADRETYPIVTVSLYPTSKGALAEALNQKPEPSRLGEDPFAEETARRHAMIAQAEKELKVPEQDAMVARAEEYLRTHPAEGGG